MYSLRTLNQWLDDIAKLQALPNQTLVANRVKCVFLYWLQWVLLIQIENMMRYGH